MRARSTRRYRRVLRYTRCVSPGTEPGLPSPVREQYLELKRQHPDALLLFRMGDFYEAFDDDAATVAGLLGIALTSRPLGHEAGRVPLAGIPHHALERYLDRLLAAGHRVALCEQTSPPGRGLVERRVVRVVTPGTADAGALVEERAHNWLVALGPSGADGRAGLAVCDVTTGVFECRQGTPTELAGEWARLRPREALLADGGRPARDHDTAWRAGQPGDHRTGPGNAREALAAPPLPPALAGLAGPGAGVTLVPRPAREFAPARAAAALAAHFAVASVAALGLGERDAATGAAGALLAYLAETWPGALPQLRPPLLAQPAAELALDPQTRRSLELFAGTRGGPALLDTLDATLTPPGARLLREWLGRPLRGRARLEARLDRVQALVEAGASRAALRQALRGLPDLERLLGRARAGTATARQLVTLRAGLERLPAVAAAARLAVEAPTPEGPGSDRPGGGGLAAGRERPTAALAARALEPLAAALGAAAEVAGLIAASLADEPPLELAEGGTARTGCDPAIDELRALAGDARTALGELEAAERAHNGIPALRLGYHRVFGYYLEVPRAQAERVPADYEPRQTLATTQRFRCPALGVLETRILEAREQLATAEGALLERVRGQVASAGAGVERAAAALARLDVAAALAQQAVDWRYVRPVLAEGGALLIEGGRHPVVERALERGAFVPNDLALGTGADGQDRGERSEASASADIVVLTGPNMGGKSTYLRQAALIALLAQCGSYVPATRARVPLFDRICARIGAQDDLSAGQSTFLVEMLETAAILRVASERSLVILDEVGRGTATQDGLAIARAVVEHLHHRPAGTPRTLFATHYHELTALAGELPRVANRAVAVAERGGELVFLHRIVEGGADRSYGVQVAALAGLPAAVVARARALLQQAEVAAAGLRPGAAAPGGERAQLSLLGTLVGPPAPPDPLLAELAGLEPDALAPLEALQRLYALCRAARARLALEG